MLESDSLVIPKSKDIIYVTGSLFNYEKEEVLVFHFEDKKADYYINNFAGGYSKSNDRSRTVVVYPNGSVKKSIDFGLFTISPKVTKGSTIRLSSQEEDC